MRPMHAALRGTCPASEGKLPVLGDGMQGAAAQHERQHHSRFIGMLYLLIGISMKLSPYHWILSGIFPSAMLSSLTSLPVP